MAEDMTAAVLGDKVAQVGAETHVGDGGLVVAPFLDGEAFEEDEAFAVEEVLAEGFEVFGEVGEGEVFLYSLVPRTHRFRKSRAYLGDTSQRNLSLEKVISRRAELLNLLSVESMCPLLGLSTVLLSLPHSPPCNFLRELLEFPNVVIQRGVLAGGLQTIGEDIPRHIAVELVRCRGKRLC